MLDKLIWYYLYYNYYNVIVVHTWISQSIVYPSWISHIKIGGQYITADGMAVNPEILLISRRGRCSTTGGMAINYKVSLVPGWGLHITTGNITINHQVLFLPVVGSYGTVCKFHDDQHVNITCGLPLSTYNKI